MPRPLLIALSVVRDLAVPIGSLQVGLRIFQIPVSLATDFRTLSGLMLGMSFDCAV